MRTTVSMWMLLFGIITCLQSKAQDIDIPENLQGYWLFKVDNNGDWNGPLIGPNFVENYYSVNYVKDMNRLEGDTILFTLESPDGNTTIFKMFDFRGDSASIYYSGWNNFQRCGQRKTPPFTDPIKPDALPDNFYNTWVKDGTAKVEYTFEKDGTLSHEGKSWKILNAGYFLNKEYRLLINHQREYKQLYIPVVTSKKLTVTSNMKRESFSAIASNPEVYAFMGNWRNTATGDWQIGFFEDFAIYDSDFWEYESFNMGKKKNEVILKKGNEKVKIQMKPLSDSTCTITFGKGKAQDFSLCKKTLGDYPVTDNSTFIDNGYQMDSVTITGYIRGVADETTIFVNYYDFISLREKYTTFKHLDQNGWFEIKFPVLNTLTGWIEIENMSIWTVFEPGESYFLHWNASTGQELWMGKNVRFQNEYAGFKIDSEYVPYQEMEEIAADKLMERWKELSSIQKQKMENFQKTHLTISDKYIYYLKQSFRYGMAHSLIQKRFFIRKENGKFSQAYLTFLEDNFIKYPMQPYTLNLYYSFFIHDYVEYMESKDRGDSWFPDIFVLEYLQEEGSITLTPEQKEAFGYYKVYMDTLFMEADTTKRLNITKQYENKIAPITAIMQDTSLFKNSDDILYYLIPIRDIKKLGLDPELTELVITRTYYSSMTYTHISLKDFLVEAYRENVKNPTLISIISDLNKKYIDITNNEIKNAASLKDNNPLEGLTEAEELLEKIIEPYKGKVIYVDFWGTWCGPCKEEMKYVKALKEDLAGKDVIFLYFANGSSEKSWKNIIKEYELTGETAVHYNLPYEQQKLLEAYFKVGFFPSYYIINKSGEVAEKNAPRPSQKEETIQALQQWLDQ